MWPHNDWLDGYHISSLIDEIVLDKGRDAFAHDGHTHLYSGPSYAVSSKIYGPYAADPDIIIMNHARAKRRAKSLCAVLIDETVIDRRFIVLRASSRASAGLERIWPYGA